MSEERDTINVLNKLWTNAELYMGALSGVFWAILDFCLGGIDTPIKALAILMCMDFITGVAAEYRKGNLSSRVGAKGLCKKSGILLCITIACMLDMAMEMDVFRGMTISAFAIIEAMSLVENVDRMDYGEYIPDFIRIHLKQIADKKVPKKEEDTNGNR